MIRRAFGQVGHVAVPKDEEYLALVRDILENEQVRSMDGYFQHGHTTCLRHSIHVSYLSYLFCKKHGLDARAAARGGLLHDLFLYDWHFYRRRKGERLHGVEHPKKALAHASALFSLTWKEREIILRHMWPLTITPPRCREAYVIVAYDKYCSLMETLHKDVMQLMLLGAPVRLPLPAPALARAKRG